MTYLRSHRYGVGKLESEPRKAGYSGTVDTQATVREASIPVSSSSSHETQIYFVSCLWIFVRVEGLW